MKKKLQIVVSISILVLFGCTYNTANNPKSKNNNLILDKVEKSEDKLNPALDTNIKDSLTHDKTHFGVDESQKIDSLKKEIFIKDLTSLGVGIYHHHHHLIKYVDSSIGNSSELRYIEIGVSKMSVLPKEFEKLKELFQLDLYVENCDKVNFDMTKLTDLSAITLYFNQNNNYHCFINELHKLRKRLSIRLHMEKHLEKNTIILLSKIKNISRIEIHNRQFGVHNEFIKNTFENIKNAKARPTGFGFQIDYLK